MSVILFTNVFVSIRNLEVWERNWTYFFLASQMFGETCIKNSSNIDLVNYNFVRCNLEAFGKKVASRPGVAMNSLSSRVSEFQSFTSETRTITF